MSAEAWIALGGLAVVILTAAVGGTWALLHSQSKSFGRVHERLDGMIAADAQMAGDLGVLTERHNTLRREFDEHRQHHPPATAPTVVHQEI